MKWLFKTGIVFLLGLTLLAGCTGQEKSAKGAPSEESSSTKEIPKSGEEIVEITEKMYLTYINEIYINAKSYLGKTIELEGMFSSEQYAGKTYYYIYRVGPGCCGNDGAMCGFEFVTEETLPKDKDWIKVKGILEEYEEAGQMYLRLKDCTVTVMEQRGKENILH